MNIKVCAKWDQNASKPEQETKFEIIPVATKEKIDLEEKVENKQMQKKKNLRKCLRLQPNMLERTIQKIRLWEIKNKCVQTRKRVVEENEKPNYCFLSQDEPKSYEEASKEIVG